MLSWNLSHIQLAYFNSQVDLISYFKQTHENITASPFCLFFFLVFFLQLHERLEPLQTPGESAIFPPTSVSEAPSQTKGGQETISLHHLDSLNTHLSICKVLKSPASSEQTSKGSVFPKDSGPVRLWQEADRVLHAPTPQCLRAASVEGFRGWCLSELLG